jgi:hypothetical protein
MNRERFSPQQPERETGSILRLTEEKNYEESIRYILRHIIDHVIHFYNNRRDKCQRSFGNTSNPAGREARD